MNACHLHADCLSNEELGAACLRDRPSPAKGWRTRELATLRIGRWLEKEAERLGLPFEVRPDWWPPAIDWCEWGQGFAQFSERVRIVTNLLGAPVEVVSAHCVSAGDRVPDLVATWRIKPPTWDRRPYLEAKVRVLAPEDVQIARPVKARTAAKTRLRSEDLHALKALATSVGVVAPPSPTGDKT